MGTYVYDFAEGDKDQKDLLGGKGANLAEMTNLGPAGAPGVHHHHRGVPGLPRGEGDDARRASPRRSPSTSTRLEKAMGDGSATPTTRCWSSVRSGAKFSMPGMMETVLNVGLNDESVQGLARAERRRALRAGTPTAGCCRCSAAPCSASTASTSPEALDALKDEARHRRATSTSTPTTCAALVETFKGIIASTAGRRFPQDPREQLDLAVRGRLRLLEHRARRALPPPGAHPRRPRHRGQRPGRWCSATAAMTSGIRGRASPATRPAATRASTATTCRTPRARTSWPASATPCRWPTSRSIDKSSYDELLAIMATLEEHYRDMCDIEFTDRAAASSGCCRPGSASARRRRRSGSPVHMVDEGLIDLDEALRRVTGAPAGAADVPAVRRRRPSASCSPRA